MRRAVLLLGLAGCPEPVYDEFPTQDCIQYQSAEVPYQALTSLQSVVGWQIEVTGPVPREAEVQLTLDLTNFVTQDCPVAIYRASEEPDLAQAPALDPESVPPQEVPHLGALVYDRLVPRTYNDNPSLTSLTLPLTLARDESVYLTLIGCDGLNAVGQLYLFEVCQESVSVQTLLPVSGGGRR